MSSDQLVKFELLCHPHHVQDQDNILGVGVNQKRGLHILDRPQGYLALPTTLGLVVRSRVVKMSRNYRQTLKRYMSGQLQITWSLMPKI